MTRIADWEQIIEEELRVLRPQSIARVTLRPILDIAVGDLGSDACLYEARNSGEDPATLAHELAARVADRIPATVEEQRGFLNLRIAAPWELLSPSTDERWGSATIPEAIVVAPPGPGGGFDAAVRLCACALLQRSLCAIFGRTPLLVVADRSWQAGEGQLLELTQAATVAARGVPSLNRFQRCTVWCSPESLTRQEFHRLVAGHPGLRAVTVRREWYSSAAIDPEQIRLLSQSEEAELVWYLAATQDALDIDLSTVGQHERANRLWYLRSTQTRITRILASSPEERSMSASAPDPNRLCRRLAVRALQLPLATREAAMLGELERWWEVQSDLLHSANRALNDPDVRRVLSTASEGTLLREILAGVAATLSDIIPPQLNSPHPGAPV